MDKTKQVLQDAVDSLSYKSTSEPQFEKEQWRSYFEEQFKVIKSKYDIEFNRYKQDCRKRALDVAYQLFVSHGGDINEEGEKEIDIKTIADKYYNWLISIPE